MKPWRTLRKLTGGRGADIAIEAVGNPEVWETRRSNRCAVAESVNFFGGCPNDSKIELDTQLLHYSEITCKASFHHTPEHISRGAGFCPAGA